MTDRADWVPKILIVDDDPDQLFISERLIEKTRMDFTVVTAAGGPQALTYLSEVFGGDPSAVPIVMFLDIRMPGMDGFNVLRWTRNRVEFSHLKVIMLSSSDDPKDAKSASDLGANGYLIKHPHCQTMACILRQVLATAHTPDAALIDHQAR